MNNVTPLPEMRTHLGEGQTHKYVETFNRKKNPACGGKQKPSYFAWPGIPAIERGCILGLEKILIHQAKPVSEEKQTNTAAISQIITRHTGITEAQLRNKGRKAPVIDARKILCMLAFEVAGISKSNIGRYLNQDHSTVIWAIHHCKDLLQTDAQMIAHYNACYPEVKALLGQ